MVAKFWKEMSVQKVTSVVDAFQPVEMMNW
jgi:hypothetical protein